MPAHLGGNENTDDLARVGCFFSSLGKTFVSCYWMCSTELILEYLHFVIIIPSYLEKVLFDNGM